MKPRILIADDEHAIVETLREVLCDEGYDVTTALNGEEALHEVSKTRPDLMILDMMMPVLDGSAVLQQVDGSGLPVILTSAGIVPQKERDKAQAFLPKPFTLDDLLQTVETLLRRENVSGNGA